ncbi:acyl-CoA dehydrogenase family protein [Actinomadura sp. CNU-125]|uniref:acyl-CoA dehydrogenase family protein n=1 Tax=Actinomadura sp. CNU-125 TaxID=1904961 RepID=UPI00096AB657|nr:acyl-CoA dehydrogenase family protein [Actinomadura sp. CNU-125]
MEGRRPSRATCCRRSRRRPVTGAAARLVPAGAVAVVVVALRGDALVAVPARPNRRARPSRTSCHAGRRPRAGRRRDDRPRGGPGRRRRARGRRPPLGGADRRGADRARRPGARTRRRLRHRTRAFGILIGGFQTVQHRLADDATALEGARLLARKAAWAHDTGEPDAGALATMALLFAAETAFTTASDSLHMHGGYGYTLEYDVQLYFRRAKAWPLVAGDPRAAYAGLPRRLYGDAAPTTAGV